MKQNKSDNPHHILKMTDKSNTKLVNNSDNAISAKT